MEMVLLLRMIQELVMNETTGDNDQFLNDMMGDHTDLVIEWRSGADTTFAAAFI